MNYLSPKSDVAFKKLFGNIAHKNILISFLNSVLKRPEHLKIIDVSINDPANTPDRPGSKYSIVDLRCTDQDQNQYIVEMQVLDQKDYIARAQYYTAIALARQLNSGEIYNQLVPVIFVGILDFELFKNKNYLSHKLILDSETYAHELKHLEFHFIELPKFTKTETQLDNILDKWVYFLKNAEALEKVPAALKEAEFTDAFGVLARSNWSNKELFEYDQYLDIWRSETSRIESAEEKRSIEIAQQLLDVLDIITIAQKTGLTVKQVEELKNKQNYS
jgi:predicted transposase/invertase (TIGR01784 family)